MTQQQYTHVGQHLFIGFHGTKLSTETRRLFDAVQPGGVVLFGRNIDSAANLRKLGHTLRTEFA